MDAHKAAGVPAAGAGAGGGGEVRRINVVYFLSRGGRTDHPHLFRVNHLNRAGGVRLRDVKRWLSELRGKDMPDNYSWSYKRKYKAGYVWQDLKDDDLITPVSDNEYVLKGCDVRGTPPPPPCCVQAPTRTSSLVERKRKEEGEADVTTHDQNRPVEVVLTPDSDESSPKPPPPADQDSPGGCESARRGTGPFKVDDKPPGLDEQKQQQPQEQVVITIEVSRSQSRRRGQKHEEGGDEAAAATDTKAAAPAPVEEEQKPQGEAGAAKGGVRAHAHAQAVGKQQARGMRVARALHNMLTCARDDTDAAALRTLATRRQEGDDWRPPPTTTTCPGMEGCGLRVSRKAARPRDGGNGKDKPQRKRDGEKKHDAHKPKPTTLPRCSQCGKEFKPQELHSHMQSCRGFKERRRSSSTSSARPSTDKRRSNWTAGGHYSSESERPSSASAVFLLTES